MAKGLLPLLDRLSDAVLVLARDGRLVHANPAAMRTFGLEVGSAWPQALPVLGTAAIDWVAECLAKPDQACEVRLQGSAGRTLNLSWLPLDERYAALRLEPAPGSDVPAEPLPMTQGPQLGNLVDGSSPLPSEAMLAQVFARSPFPVLIEDEHSRLVDVNAAMCEFTGLPRERLIGIDLEVLLAQDEREQPPAQRPRPGSGTAANELLRPQERRLVDGHGRERWFRSSRHSLTGPQGQRYVLCILQDSTAEHQAVVRADRFLRELDQWFDLATVGMVLLDGTGLLVRTNRTFEALVGEVPIQVGDAGPALQTLLGWQEGHFKAAETGGSWHGHALVAHEDGSTRSLRAIVRAYPISFDQRRFLAVVEDHTAEDERDLVQSQMGTLMDTAGVGVVTLKGPMPPQSDVDSSGRHPPQEVRLSTGVLQSISRELVMPESLPHYERLQLALREGRRDEIRYAIQHPQLGVRWLQTRIEPMRLASGQRSTSVVTMDVTEAQRAQLRNDQLLRELSTILEGTTAGIAYVRGDVLVRCNPRFEHMLGLPGGQAIGSSLHELFSPYPQAHRLAVDSLTALTAGGVYETEIEVTPGADLARFGEPGARASTARWISLSLRRAAEPTPVPEVIAVLTDITRLKVQQRELEVLLRDRELMFSLSDVGIAFIRDERVQRANEALAALVGYRVEEMAHLPVEALFVSREEFDRDWPLEQRLLEQTGYWMGERQLRCRDGSLIWAQISKRLLTDGEFGAGVIASYVDIDERRRAQDAIAVQAERTRAVLDSVLVGIVTVGPQGIEWMNRSARRMFAGDLRDFIGLPISTVGTGEPHHPFVQTHYLESLAEGQAETFECRVKARDGREFWVVGNVVAIGDGTHERQLTFALLDIERRRQAEVRIEETQASLQRIIEATPMAITLVDGATLRIMQANQAAANAAGLPVDGLIGLRPDDWMSAAPAQRRLADMRAALAAGAPTQTEVREGQPGAERVWETRYVPVGAAGRDTEQLLVVATDVTEQRLAQEARFEAALAQREMLVKEVHHRIKNNLQGVAGLLEQIAKRKPEVANTIAEVVGQVQAIAQVYGLQVGVSGALRVQSVVQAITHSVERTFGRQIRFDVQGEDPEGWLLPEAEAIPIALSLNELLTNAIKHSPVDDSVDCRLMSQREDLQVSVANRGTVPDGFRLERFPMGVSGLGLVRALLPRRSAGLTIKPQGDRVVATLSVRPPGVKRDNEAIA